MSIVSFHLVVIRTIVKHAQNSRTEGPASALRFSSTLHQSEKENTRIYEKDCSVVSTWALIQLKHMHASQAKTHGARHQGKHRVFGETDLRCRN